MADDAEYPKRLIEVDLPIKEISRHARREKFIRQGHISTLHIWWARRPLAACRAVLCATLWPDPADDLCPQSFRDTVAEALVELVEAARSRRDLRELLEEHWTKRWNRLGRGAWQPTNPACWWDMRYALLDFIADFANWDASAHPDFLATARRLTEAAHEGLGGAPGTRPLVVDPFAGGGSIPFEALRVGADAFASDLNPVAVLLNKVQLEYIRKYGQGLATEVRKWGEWIRARAENELAVFYPNDPDGATPIAYLWARTYISSAPAQGELPVEVPLLRSMWLSKRPGRQFALRWRRNTKGNILTDRRTVILEDGTIKEVLRPQLEVFGPRAKSDVESGTSKNGSATCPITGFTAPVEDVRKQLTARHGGASDARLIAVVVASAGSGRRYRLANQGDEGIYLASQEALRVRRRADDTRTVHLPDGRLSHLRGFFNVVLYGMERWGDLFSNRQALSVTTFGELVAGLDGQLAPDPNLTTAIKTCLAITVDRLAEKLTSVARWDVTRENPQGTFGRQALPMVWDFCEVNPFSGAGGDWNTALDWVARVLEANAVVVDGASGVGHAEQSSATALSLPDDACDALFTDPPYYAAVPYADLSDFFFSWLRQTIGDHYPELFGESLSPKKDELVSLAHRAAMYREKNAAWFELQMAKACAEAGRVCKPDGVGVFVFANKETEGWEAMLSALIQSGWIISASWPIDTEMTSRLRARNSAVLASSVHLVGRPRQAPADSPQADSVGDWRELLRQLPRRIHDWMPHLAEQGVVGADAIFACLGPALEIFSRYSRVEKAGGEVVTLKEYLAEVWAAVAREALSMVFRDADATALEEDARLTAMWLWTSSAVRNGKKNGSIVDDKGEQADDDEEDDAAGESAAGYTLEYDAARKVAQGLGAHLESLNNLVEVKGKTARLLSVAERTRYLFGRALTESASGTKAKRDYQLGLFKELEAAERDGEWADAGIPSAEATTLDRIHQAMILFGAGRADALKRFLVDDGVGADARFWTLAQSLSALYPSGTDEKRWVDGVLARKKGLGFG